MTEKNTFTTATQAGFSRTIDEQDIGKFWMDTQDKRQIVLVEGNADNQGHPLLVLDIFSVDNQRQATVKLNFYQINTLKNALDMFYQHMLDGMCDY